MMAITALLGSGVCIAWASMGLFRSEWERGSAWAMAGVALAVLSHLVGAVP